VVAPPDAELPPLAPPEPAEFGSELAQPEHAPPIKTATSVNLDTWVLVTAFLLGW